MEGTQKRLAFLDSHIVVWLYDALTSKFSKKVVSVINESELVISPLVKLELQYLYEIKKIKVRPSPIVASLTTSIGLHLSETSFEKIIEVGITLDWTRDPFDRMLVAEAYIHNAQFITKDKTILKNYPLAVW